MELIRRALSIAMMLVMLSLTVYVLWFNQERVVIDIPGFEPLSVVAAFAYLGFFVAGIICSSCYFAMEILRKSWELRSCQKRLRKLEAVQLDSVSHQKE